MTEDENFDDEDLDYDESFDGESFLGEPFNAFGDGDSNAPMYKSLLLEILDEQEHLKIDTDLVRSLALSVLETAGVTAGKINLVFADNEVIQQINREFLEHDYPTDVISFALETDLANGYLEGEVIVSCEMAIELAADYGTSPETESMLYAVHGLLHLVGYDDQDAENRQIMRRREREILASVGIKLTGTHYDSADEAEVLRN